MNVKRLFAVLVVGAGALVSGACATSSGASGGEEQRLPDGGVAAPAAPKPMMQPSGAPSGW
jgi:hypothetical protein